MQISLLGQVSRTLIVVEMKLYLSKSTPLQIQVRGDRLFVTSYVWDDGITLAGNSIPAGAGQQVYLFNASRNDIENISLETSQNALLL